MKNDPIIQAIRDVRHQISESMDHDPRKLLEYYRIRQKRYGDRLISRQMGDSELEETSTV
jgi:hypothetical protein